VWSIAWKEKDDAIGSCSLWNFDHSHTRAEIGYELGLAYWHQGIMTEALTAVLRHGFIELRLHLIEAAPQVINEPS
jgi:ribosomal-protein-alanine N-acetyltransferase